MTRNRTALRLALAALVLVIAVTLFLIVNARNPMLPECNWRIQGFVVDESTNPIAGATLHAFGHGKVTSLNNVFGIQPKQIDLVMTTDKSGKFNLNVRASGFAIYVHKTGREEKRLIFECNDNAGAESNRIQW
jgi:hypothetical protein